MRGDERREKGGKEKKTEMEKRSEMEVKENLGGDKGREIMCGKESEEESVDSKH